MLRKEVVKTKFDLSRIAENIRAYRIEANLSQLELGNLMGVSPQMISCYERALSCPSLETLTRIHDYFGADLNYLLANDHSYQERPKTIRLSEAEMEIILTYRRRTELKQQIIRTICFENTKYRTLEQEIKDLEEYIEFLKKQK